MLIGAEGGGGAGGPHGKFHSPVSDGNQSLICEGKKTGDGGRGGTIVSNASGGGGGVAVAVALQALRVHHTPVETGA
jgi:hypothetical protein